MKNYIAKINLGEYGNAFACIVGVLSVGANNYICDSITEDGELYHSQTFTLEKSIDGLPANNKTLETDVLKGWKKHLEKIERNKNHD